MSTAYSNGALCRTIVRPGHYDVQPYLVDGFKANFVTFSVILVIADHPCVTKNILVVNYETFDDMVLDDRQVILVRANIATIVHSIAFLLLLLSLGIRTPYSRVLVGSIKIFMKSVVYLSSFESLSSLARTEVGTCVLCVFSLLFATWVLRRGSQTADDMWNRTILRSISNPRLRSSNIVGVWFELFRSKR